MLLSSLHETMIASLKKGDTVTVETLRFLIAAVRTEAINLYGSEAESKVTDTDVLSVIKKQVKTHKESVEAFEKAGRNELADKEKAQLVVLMRYLPEELSDAELRALLEPVAKDGGEFGPMMGRAMQIVKGRADGNRVSAVLRQLLM